MGKLEPQVLVRHSDCPLKISISSYNYFEMKPEDKEDLTINSGKVLVLLTEAPTSSFIQWSSAIYEKFGSVKKMISTGHHTPDVWKSIIFQLFNKLKFEGNKKQILLLHFYILHPYDPHHPCIS